MSPTLSSSNALPVIWGVGVVHWQKDGRIVDRPLLEVRVDVELDDARGGTIRVRPTSAEPSCDLKPYEELGCHGLPQLSDLIRRELQRAADAEGLSPFVSESFEPVLSPAASRLDSEGCYAPDSAPSQGEPDPTRLTVSDRWVLFARPRSQHIVLQDIDRLRKAAEDEDKPIGGVAERLVTEPSRTAPTGRWQPLADHLQDVEHLLADQQNHVSGIVAGFRFAECDVPADDELVPGLVPASGRLTVEAGERATARARCYWLNLSGARARIY